MGHFKIVFFCFFFAGILIFRSTATRPIHMSVRTEINSNEALAPVSPFLVPAESPEGSENDEGGEQTEKHHRSSESVAGGGVIIGGLVTVTFAAVYCYIRVTRKRDGQH
ncbi:hypothetical protein QVD17_03708 [Tagetes erecta]|uniref:Transmembrane protein n=1 Tax=Tagetes erecta TaxID=13708 RepID=A0AAD8LBE4_TARER|nr:hypothetical protein QVD17_03708 [Tagetes erecta]